jgi:acetyl esterase/lipase
LLVQASEAEMLVDDSRRYVNKAVAAGSPVTLQTWNHMVHVWQIYHPELLEGREAFEERQVPPGQFLTACKASFKKSPT